MNSQFSGDLKRSSFLGSAVKFDLTFTRVCRAKLRWIKIKVLAGERKQNDSYSTISSYN